MLLNQQLSGFFRIYGELKTTSTLDAKYVLLMAMITFDLPEELRGAHTEK